MIEIEWVHKLKNY